MHGVETNLPYQEHWALAYNFVFSCCRRQVVLNVQQCFINGHEMAVVLRRRRFCPLFMFRIGQEKLMTPYF